MAEDPDTRARLLEAAEMLFAEQGYEGASLRAITRKAKANLAAVNYHFGSKEGLLRASILRHIEPLNQERLALLDALEARPDQAPSLEEILKAFLGPCFHLAEREPRRWQVLNRFMGRFMAEPSEHWNLVSDVFAAVFQRYGRALGRHLSQVPVGLVGLRLHFVVGAMLHSMRSGHLLHHMAGTQVPGLDRETVLCELVRFAAAGLRTPGGGP